MSDCCRDRRHLSRRAYAQCRMFGFLVCLSVCLRSHAWAQAVARRSTTAAVVRRKRRWSSQAWCIFSCFVIFSQHMLPQCIGTKQMPNVVQAQIQPLSRPWQRLQRSRPMMVMTAMHIWLMHWLRCKSMAMMKQKRSITVGAYLACLVTELCLGTSSTSKVHVTANICAFALN